MKYRKEIDGLRAITIIPVILFHAGFEIFEGGYVGVDVFFVISGYLITSLILKEKNEGDFNVLKFYERRARRILPALFFVTMSPKVTIKPYPASLESKNCASLSANAKPVKIEPSGGLNLPVNGSPCPRAEGRL